jgi:hypothetical protein
MPLNGITTLVGALIMFGSWAVIGQKLKSSPGGGSVQSRLLQKFFFYFGLFYVFIFAPYIVLTTNPDAFPLAMAVGYVVSHVFMYIAFTYIIRLMFSMLPRVASKSKYAVGFYSVLLVVITAVNAITMIWGTRPEFDSQSNLTLFHAHPVVGAFIGLSGLLTVLPTAILMLVSSVTNPSARSRAFLLGIGFIILTAGGPLHDVAKTETMYMLADIISIAGLLVLARGVTYKVGERLTMSRAVSSKS